MRKIFTISLAVLGAMVFGQFTTPGTGQTYTITDLDALTDDLSYDEATQRYILTNDLTISTTDTFLADSDFTLAIEPGKLISVAGSIQVNAPNLVHFTTLTEGSYFQGLRLQSGATAQFNNFKMTYGGGIRDLGSTFLMENSEVSFQNSGISTGAAINFSGGNPIIRNSRFESNRTPAVASGANQSVALTFENNYLFSNNLENSNRPQINMGPSGVGATTIIRGNTIIGNRAMTRAGGISVSSLLGVDNEFLIENNLIQDNRYGITTTGGNTKGNIINNRIIDNNTEPVPANGGSGINIYLAQNRPDYVINIFENTITGNLWGLTNIGAGAQINLGDANRYGHNVFDGNGNEGVTYAFYNNSPVAVSAQGNCWDNWLTEERAEEVIFHFNDDETLGLVDYSNFVCLLNTKDESKKQLKLYPNPSNGKITVEVEQNDTYQLFDLTGKQIEKGELKKGKNDLNLKLSKGVYVLKTTQSTRKIIIK